MIEALILGIAQGVTEFFPVSSTAHLILLPWFFTWGGDLNTLTFDVALHSTPIIAGATLLHAQKDGSGNRPLLPRPLHDRVCGVCVDRFGSH